MQEGQDVLASLLQSSTRTWQLTDGRGAVSRGTASGAATRRDHALLAVPDAGPRPGLPAVALLRFDDRVVAGGAPAVELTPAFVLSARRDAGPTLTVRAEALPLLESFHDWPWPAWRFRGEGWLLERTYRLIEGHAALIATWRLLEGGPLKLHVAPLMVARALAGLQAETPEFRGAVGGVPGRVKAATVEGYTPLTLWHNGGFMPARAWHRGLAYPVEATDALAPDAAGAIPAEDAFLPGWVQYTLDGSHPALNIVVSPDEALFRTLAGAQRLGTPPARSLADCIAALDVNATDLRTTWQTVALSGASNTARQAATAHAARRSPDAAEVVPAEFDVADPELVSLLATRVHDALYERADRTAVITDATRATEYGPDALRAAASLVTLRSFGAARDIARGYLAYIDEGLAPESFDAQGMPIYESPETSLWLVHVIDLLARRDAESEATQSFLRDGGYRALEGVLQHLRAGSRHGVGCDRDGFLWAGEGPAARCRADLNALWYHVLVAMSQLAKQASRRENSAFYMAWARELQRAYVDRFWDAEAGCLFPEFAAAGPVRGVTPSQLYAVSLPPLLLPPELASRLVDTVTRELWEPRGLRPQPGDAAPDPGWLGVWAAATMRASGRSEAAEKRVREALTHAAGLLLGRTHAAPATGDDAMRELTSRGAADLLRAWIEEVEHRGATLEQPRLV